MSPPPKTITVFTRRAPGETEAALRRLVVLAGEAGITVRVPVDEVAKHDLSDLPGAELGADPDGRTDLAVVMGGDGTILTAMRRYAGRDVPVFAINFGAIGFLSTVERDDLDDAINRALIGEFDVLRLPALAVGTSSGEHLAVNDISFHRRQDLRVAELGYSVVDAELGEVRCDGLVVATPAGSTGYNLANGGPVMAWGVQGYVVSFIAPHTFTARALVVAPGDALTITNTSRDDDAEVHVDGRPACVLPASESLTVEFGRSFSQLAQLPGASFYHRLRERFGRLAR